MKLTKLFNEFFESEKSGGILLLCATSFSLLIANSALQAPYINFWNYSIANHSITHWINDGLMAIFFLLIGLELEREIYLGELANFKNAILPILAAIGGILLPAGIFLSFNYGTKSQSGAGIPMATDIAFAIGILSLLGNRVPASLKIFLTALAVIDDLGAILIIAIFYTKTLVITNLFISLGIFFFLILLNRFKVKILFLYLIGGIAMWYFMLNSGVHATITGVLLAFAIPFDDGTEDSISYKLQHFLHKPVAFLILPIFALANTSIQFDNNILQSLAEFSSLGILLGLVFGKPIGIFLFSYLGVKFAICSLPTDLNWKQILSVGFLGGIGFTMSIFITLLAYEDQSLINSSKISILIASLIAGISGYLLLNLHLKKNNSAD